jgi:gluconolactonase
VSEDQKTLYVVDSDQRPSGVRKIYAYDLAHDGSVGGRRIVHDFGTGRGGDGMCLDELGNLYVAAGFNVPSATEDASVSAGVYVFTPAGERVGMIPVPHDTITNVAFGDPDLRTLYITCGATLLFVRLRVRGYVRWPRAME